MLKYIFKRILHLIPVIFLISVILFSLIQLMPGDPVNAYLGVGSNVSAAQQQQIREKLGLDQPAYVQYVKWAGRTLTGDLGRSMKHRKPVTEVIGTFIGNSFILNVFAMIFAFGIAIPAGIKSAVKKYGLFDNTFTVFTFMGVSMPSFFFALILVFFVAVPLPFIPLSGMRDTMMSVRGYPSFLAEVFDVGRHMILPVIVLTILSLASLTRYVRNSVIEVINQDYIRTARSKGLKEKVVIYKHAFRNALLPLITILGMWIPRLFAGSVLLETVFLWPGVGRILYQSIVDRDTTMLMAANMFYALLRVSGNLLADVSYGLADPRVRIK